jgi:hypothetical protein
MMQPSHELVEKITRALLLTLEFHIEELVREVMNNSAQWQVRRCVWCQCEFAHRDKRDRKYCCKKCAGSANQHAHQSGKVK